MKSGLRFQLVKYLFVALYLGLLSTVFIRLFVKSRSDLASFIILASVFAVSLTLAFLPVGSVKIGFNKRRLPAVLSLVVFSLMAAVLLIGINLAPSEFFRGWYGRVMSAAIDDKYFLIVVGSVWLVLFVLGLLMTLGKDPEVVYKRVLAGLLAGSVLELVVSVPLHLVISKRGGCFVGLTSMVGVSAGIIVLLLALGPSLFLFGLHYYNRWKK